MGKSMKITSKWRFSMGNIIVPAITGTMIGIEFFRFLRSWEWHLPTIWIIYDSHNFIPEGEHSILYWLVFMYLLSIKKRKIIYWMVWLNLLLAFFHRSFGNQTWKVMASPQTSHGSLLGRWCLWRHLHYDVHPLAATDLPSRSKEGASGGDDRPDFFEKW